MMYIIIFIINYYYYVLSMKTLKMLIETWNYASAMHPHLVRRSAQSWPRSCCSPPILPWRSWQQHREPLRSCKGTWEQSRCLSKSLGQFRSSLGHLTSEIIWIFNRNPAVKKHHGPRSPRCCCPCFLPQLWRDVRPLWHSAPQIPVPSCEMPHLRGSTMLSKCHKFSVSN
jgi:hypothetical protein